jgi:hypothetical protein
VLLTVSAASVLAFVAGPNPTGPDERVRCTDAGAHRDRVARESQLHAALEPRDVWLAAGAAAFLSVAVAVVTLAGAGGHRRGARSRANRSDDPRVEAVSWANVCNASWR